MAYPFRRCAGAILALVLLFAVGQASAHNTFSGSDPAAGATLEAAPTTMVFRFANPVPLDSATIDVIDSTGTRTRVASLTHGSGGNREVVAAMPSLAAGAVTTRWRLVSADGHAITGRVAFTVAGAAAGTPTSTPDLADPWQVPSPVRWMIRWVGYLAMMVVAGAIVAAGWMAPGVWQNMMLRRRTTQALVALGATAGLQLLMLAGDRGARSPFTAWGDLPGALSSGPGAALGVRVVVAGGLAAVLSGRLVPPSWRWHAAGGLALVGLVTWAWAGHGRSLRWPAVGVPIDVAHHAAAAVWLGGLGVLGALALRERDPDRVIGPLRHFTQVAPVAVGVLVASGVLQAVRVGGVPDFGATHTRILIAKLVVLAVMLKVADINRRRVARRLMASASISARFVANLRRAVVLEFVLGVVILALTAALVVTPAPVLLP